MFKFLKKKKKDESKASKRSSKPTISPPLPPRDQEPADHPYEDVTPDQQQQQLVIAAEVEPATSGSIEPQNSTGVSASTSRGTQAEFSPVRANPSLLTAASTCDSSYSIVHDAIPQGRAPQKIKSSTNRAKQPQPPSYHSHHQRAPAAQAGDEDDMTDVTESEESDVSQEEDTSTVPVYAQVRKDRDTRQIREGERRREVTFENDNTRRRQHTESSRHDRYHDENESDQETTHSHAHVPSHRPPPSSSSRRVNQSLPTNLTNLPVYNLDQTVPLASGEQAYLLTRRGPDGKDEHFTATVITPSPSPPKLPPSGFTEEQRSSSIPVLPSTPLVTSTPLSHAQSLQSTFGIEHSDAFLSLPATANARLSSSNTDQSNLTATAAAPNRMKRKTKTLSSQGLVAPPPQGLVAPPPQEAVDWQHQASYRATDERIDSLKESLAQLAADVSNYSLEATDTDVSLEGVSPEQLLQHIPQRLHNALKSMNQSLTDKDNQLRTYEAEIIRLKGECNELKKANLRMTSKDTQLQSQVVKLKDECIELRRSNQELTKVSREQAEMNKQEKNYLERSFSKVEEEKEHLSTSLQNLKEKLKHTKDRHKARVKKLTSDLQKLSQERDGIHRELSEIQQSHAHVQTLVDHTPRHSKDSIPLEEHRKSLREFEFLLQDVIKTSQSNRKLQTLNSENISLTAKLNNIQQECAVLRREQRNYEERIFKLQADLQHARARELAAASELTQAIRSSVYPSRVTAGGYPTPFHRSVDRLHEMPSGVLSRDLNSR